MKFLSALILSILIISVVKAQDNIIQLEYKKGEVLDIILASTQYDSGDEYNKYRKTAFPIAFEYSFELMPVFDIEELIVGTSFPTTFIFGKWESVKKREGFLDDITTRLPDFHEQRRNLFSYFGLTYYEVVEDLTFFINEEKHIIANAFWEEERLDYTAFFEDWKKNVEEAGGRIIVELTNGTSPTGYFYNPDSFILVEWQSKDEFENFSKNTPLSEYDILKNIHQFRIE
ncbi:MAG: hypothetical protein BalsKO_27960 [Balneolaceae bacterium]